MSNTQFKVGDVVKLRSGGPKMTISAARDNSGDYTCVWFKGASREVGYFKDEILMKAD